MKFMIMTYEAASDIEARSDQKRQIDYWSGWKAYSEALVKARVFVDGAGLQPATSAATVQIRDGKRTQKERSVGRGKEQLGGYYVIDVPTRDQALEWAARCPCACNGTVEVRPLLSAQ